MGAKIVPSGAYTLNVGGAFNYDSPLAVGIGAAIQVQGVGSSLAVKGDVTIGGQLVAKGGGKITSSNGGNIFAAANGEVISTDGGSVFSTGGGSVVATDGGIIFVLTGGSLGANFVSHNSALLTPAFSGGASPAAAPVLPSASVVIQSGGTITLEGGTLFADNLLQIGSNGLLTGFGTANVTNATSSGNIAPANGTLTLNAPLTFNAGSLGGASPLIINDTLTLNANLSLAGNLRTNTLTLNTATLDLAGNKLILEPTTAAKPAALAALQNEILSAAIFSTLLPPHTALALLDNAALQIPFTTFAGIPTDANSLLLAPELLGDANIDGTIDLTDLSTLLNNFGATTPAWTSGNFDNAPTIDLTDLSDVLNNFGAVNINPSPTSTLAAPSSVPEPAPLALLLAGAGLALSKRRSSAQFLPLPHTQRP